jgi:hypothetical protein
VSLSSSTPDPTGTGGVANATGKLTVHGVARDGTISLQARWSTSGIDVVGSMDVQFADYDITPPNVGPVSVGDQGTLELQLRFVEGS